MTDEEAFDISYFNAFDEVMRHKLDKLERQKEILLHQLAYATGKPVHVIALEYLGEMSD